MFGHNFKNRDALDRTIKGVRDVEKLRSSVSSSLPPTSGIASTPVHVFVTSLTTVDGFYPGKFVFRDVESSSPGTEWLDFPFDGNENLCYVQEHNQLELEEDFLYEGVVAGVFDLRDGDDNPSPVAYNGFPLVTVTKPNSSQGHVLKKSADYTLVNGNYGCLVTFSATATLTAPTPGSDFADGWLCDVEARTGATVTISPTASTVDGAASLVLPPNHGVRLWSDGTNWFTERGHFTSPLTTAGDIFYHDGTTAYGRFPVGASPTGYLLSVDTALTGKLKYINPATDTTFITNVGIGFFGSSLVYGLALISLGGGVFVYGVDMTPDHTVDEPPFVTTSVISMVGGKLRHTITTIVITNVYNVADLLLYRVENPPSTSYTEINSCLFAACCAADELTLAIDADQTSGPGPLVVNFTPTPSGGVGPFTYLWVFGDGDTSTNEAPLHSYTGEDAYAVLCTVTDACGRTAEDSMVITVTPDEGNVVFDIPGTDTFTPTYTGDHKITLWGGGGSGGDGAAGPGGGGGGGAVSIVTVALTIGVPVSYTVGAAGASGGDGGDSLFGIVALAKGGQTGGGGGGAGGQSSLGTGDTKYDGGNGSIGNGSDGGGAGSSAGTGANGNSTIIQTGATAPAGGGDGGDGGNNGLPGQAGDAPGGGGGGNGNGGSGGANGGVGRVKIEWPA